MEPAEHKQWAVHDPERPLPPVIHPGDVSLHSPPSDAAVLFDGTTLSGWKHLDGRPARWHLEDGFMEVTAGTGDIQTQDSFGDCQLYVEWATPVPVKGEGQQRGNSGVFLMAQYEIQVLDSYENPTYADGQAAAIYGQKPPLVNTCLPPGEWQTYDIVFRRPRFDQAGRVRRPAIMTIFHNGVLVQDHVRLTGPTAHKERPPYTKHPPRLPLRLQDHGDPVRFKRIWIRDVEAEGPESS